MYEALSASQSGIQFWALRLGPLIYYVLMNVLEIDDWSSSLPLLLLSSETWRERCHINKPENAQGIFVHLMQTWYLFEQSGKVKHVLGQKVKPQAIWIRLYSIKPLYNTRGSSEVLFARGGGYILHLSKRTCVRHPWSMATLYKASYSDFQHPSTVVRDVQPGINW